MRIPPPRISSRCEGREGGPTAGRVEAPRPPQHRTGSHSFPRGPEIVNYREDNTKIILPKVLGLGKLKFCLKKNRVQDRDSQGKLLFLAKDSDSAKIFEGCKDRFYYFKNQILKNGNFAFFCCKDKCNVSTTTRTCSTVLYSCTSTSTLYLQYCAIQLYIH